MKNIEIIHLNKNSIFHSFKRWFIEADLRVYFLNLLPLHNQLKVYKPKYLVIHLITSLPLILFIFQDYETKLILRVSGLPKMTFIRKIIWKLSSNKIHKITCPTQDTYKDLSRFSYLKDKLIILKDPIIKSRDIQKAKKKHVNISEDVEKILSNNDFFLSPL